MDQPTPRPAAIVAVTSDDDRHAPVVKRASAVAPDAGSTVILWDRGAAVSPLESPLPTEWSGDGEQQQFGDRLAPNDLVAAGRERLARQVGDLRRAGIDAWGWLPSKTNAEDLARYAADQHADLVLVSSEDADLIADLRDLDEHDSSHPGPRLRVETVPV
jgi:hypothetical protein